MATLPYVTAPGNIEKALRGIKSAATPETVSQDFVKTILQVRGGSGNQITSFLRKLGFVNADGTPSDIYKAFRNPATSGQAAAQALKNGYPALYKRNEYMHQLDDEQLRGLIIEETGQGDDSSVVGLVLASIKALKKFASEAKPAKVEPEPTALVKTIAPDLRVHKTVPDTPLGLNLAYTINLNLPASSDPAVFNAIFKALRENLLRESDE
jgi:hypothetical protein